MTLGAPWETKTAGRVIAGPSALFPWQAPGSPAADPGAAALGGRGAVPGPAARNWPRKSGLRAPPGKLDHSTVTAPGTHPAQYSSAWVRTSTSVAPGAGPRSARASVGSSAPA